MAGGCALRLIVLRCIKPLAVDVVIVVKFHSSQPEKNQFIATIVSEAKTAANQEGLKEEALKEKILEDLALVKRKKCTPLSAASAEQVVRSLSNQTEKNQFIAVHVLAKPTALHPAEISTAAHLALVFPKNNLKP